MIAWRKGHGAVGAAPVSYLPDKTIRPTRLSVNIGRDTVTALEELTVGKNIGPTEALRRLVGYGIIVFRADRDGDEILIRRRNGTLERIIPVD